MTKTEAAAYEELGRTPEQIAARAAELDVKFGTHTNGAAEVTPARARKPRSDKGSVKGPKVVAQAPAGKLPTAEQLDKLRTFMTIRQEAADALVFAQANFDAARKALDSYLESLTV